MFNFKCILLTFLMFNIITVAVNASERDLSDSEESATIVADAETATSINVRDSALNANANESDSAIEREEETNSDTTDNTYIEDTKQVMPVESKESENVTFTPEVVETTSDDMDTDMNDTNSGLVDVTTQIDAAIEMNNDANVNISDNSEATKIENNELSINTSDATISEQMHNETMTTDSVNGDTDNETAVTTEGSIEESKEDESAANNSGIETSNEMSTKTEEVNTKDSSMKETNDIDPMKTHTSPVNGNSLDSNVPESDESDQSSICDFKDEVVCDGFQLVCWGDGYIDCDDGETQLNAGNEKKGRKFTPKNVEILCKMSPQLKCARKPLITECRGKSVCKQTILENPSDRPLRYWEVAIIAAITAAAGVTVITIITVVFISLTRLKIGPEIDLNRRTLSV